MECAGVEAATRRVTRKGLARFCRTRTGGVTAPTGLCPAGEGWVMLLAHSFFFFRALGTGP